MFDYQTGSSRPLKPMKPSIVSLCCSRGVQRTDSQIHQFLQTPLQCWGADACLISDTGAFRAGFQGILGFLSSKEHEIFSSQKPLTLPEHTIPGIFTFLLLSTSYRVLGCWALSWRSLAWREDSWRARHWERIFTGCLSPSALVFIPWLK